MTTRRDFVATAAALGAAAVLKPEDAKAQGSTARTGKQTVIASANGLRGTRLAYERLNRGTDTLDAIISGVNLTELDPEDTSVGLGGLPNANGVVQLDASVMHGPTKRAGAVACLEDIATPSLVAKAIMDFTDHILLVGRDARTFAVEMGFQTQNLLTEKTRQIWLRWRATRNPNDMYLDYEGDVRIPMTTGTINMSCVNTAGDISSVTSTSGMAWKVPGRVGDSPIVGAGQYCDNTVGAAGSTGRGEANIKVCGAFLTVEFMRQGLAPQAAALKTLERLVAMTERRLLDDRGRPKFDIQFYAVAKDGRYGSASLYQGAKFAVCDERGERLEDCAYLYPNSERPR